MRFCGFGNRSKGVWQAKSTKAGAVNLKTLDMSHPVAFGVRSGGVRCACFGALSVTLAFRVLASPIVVAVPVSVRTLLLALKHSAGTSPKHSTPATLW